MKKIFLILFVSLLFLPSCRRGLYLHNDYVISDDGMQGFGCYLMCNPGNSCSPLVEHIYAIEYNRKIFIIEQYIPLEDRWYIVKPGKEEELTCNWCDSLFGPFTEKEKDDFLKNEEPGKLKRETFSYRGLTREKYYDHVVEYYDHSGRYFDLNRGNQEKISPEEEQANRELELLNARTWEAARKMVFSDTDFLQTKQPMSDDAIAPYDYHTGIVGDKAYNQIVYIKALERAKKYLMVEDNQFVWELKSGAEINIAEDLFEYIIDVFHSWNGWITEGLFQIIKTEEGYYDLDPVAKPK